MNIKKNTAEILLNFHDRFLREGTDNGHRANYFEMLIDNTPELTMEQLETRDNIYSAKWNIEVSHIFAGASDQAVIEYNSSPALTKTKFGNFFIGGVEAGVIKFPFSFIDFAAFDTFRNANNVSGRLQLSYDEQECQFILSGDFVTRAPAPLNGYAPSFVIKSNKDLYNAVEKMSAVFGQAGGK